MKRSILITMIGLIFMFGLWVNVNAEMAKEGEGTFKAYYSYTVRSLPTTLSCDGQEPWW